MKIKCSADLSDFRPGGNAGIHQELAQYLREKIESGVLRPGDRLPSLREMAELWNTNFFSVKLATDLLVKFGLLNKQHGRGMFVAPQAEGIHRVGLYTSKLYGSRSDRITFSVLRDILQEKFQARGIECIIFDDCRPEEQHREIPDALQQAILSGRIQAVIGVVVRAIDNSWFDRIPICKSFIMSDMQYNFSALSRQLKERNCRRIAGIISGGPPDRPSFLLAELRAAGIKIMPRNLRIIPDNELTTRSWGEIGYRYTMELLTAQPQPDALIVYPDNAVPGAIQAILRLGIRVPEELFTVFHRNLELSYFCSFDTAYIDSKIENIADRLIETIIGNEEKPQAPAIRSQLQKTACGHKNDHRNNEPV